MIPGRPMIAWLAVGVMVAAGGASLAIAVMMSRHVVVTVRGTSMLPTLAPGDRLLVRRCRASRLKAGDVVVIGTHSRRPPSPWGTLRRRELDGPWLVKRVAALPRERVPDAVLPVTLPNVVVPEGHLVVLGDHAPSADSRQLGYFSADALLGKMLRRLSAASAPQIRPPFPPRSRTM